MDGSVVSEHEGCTGRIAALEQHVSDLEKSLENARKERDEAVLVVERVRGGLADAGVPVAVSPQEWLRVSWLANERRKAESERDAALADNAALLAALIKSCTLCHGKGEHLPSCSRCDDSTDDHECPGWRKCEHDLLLLEIKQSHPGAALLEQHREALAAAARRHETTRATMQVREEEHRRAAETSRNALNNVLEKLREDLARHGVQCVEGGLVGSLNGIDRVAVRARNEGLEKAARYLVRVFDQPTMADEIRSMKEPEGGQS